MKPLVCIRHQENAPLGIIEEVLEQEGIEWHYHDAWKEPRSPTVDEVSGLIVLGGAMNADEVDGHPHLAGTRQVVNDAVTASKPVLGICLGAQILARALGGDVYRAPVREVGFTEVRSTGVTDDVLQPFTPKSRVFQFHEDTCSLPARADLLFTNDAIAVQAFRAGRYAYGVQFHFEVTMDEIAEWCDEVADLETAWGRSKEEVLHEAHADLTQQQESGREVARRFIHLVQSADKRP